jgi:hypothetical protein
VAILNPQQVTPAGLVPALTPASGGGDKMPVGPTHWLVVNNGGGAPITVTITGVRPCDQGVTHNAVVSVANGTVREIGPIDGRYASNVDGMANIGYSGVTSVTVGAKVV